MVGRFQIPWFKVHPHSQQQNKQQESGSAATSDSGKPSPYNHAHGLQTGQVVPKLIVLSIWNILLVIFTHNCNHNNTLYSSATKKNPFMWSTWFHACSIFGVDYSVTQYIGAQKSLLCIAYFVIIISGIYTLHAIRT